MVPTPGDPDSSGAVRFRSVRWTLVAVLAGGILVSSVLPAGGGSLGAPGPFGVVRADKWIHAGAYAALAGALALALARAPDRRGVALVVLAVAGFGLGVEVLQAALPWRTFAPADAAANALGGAVTAGVWWVLGRVAGDRGPESGGSTERGPDDRPPDGRGPDG